MPIPAGFQEVKRFVEMNWSWVHRLVLLIIKLRSIVGFKHKIVSKWRLLRVSPFPRLFASAPNDEFIIEADRRFLCGLVYLIQKFKTIISNSHTKLFQNGGYLSFQMILFVPVWLAYDRHQSLNELDFNTYTEINNVKVKIVYENGPMSRFKIADI